MVLFTKLGKQCIVDKLPYKSSGLVLCMARKLNSKVGRGALACLEAHSTVWLTQPYHDATEALP